MEHVNHPSHYCAEGRKECIVEMVEKYGFMATAHFALLSAYKYLYRAGDKDGNPKEQDEKKAEFYLNWVTENAPRYFGEDIFESKLYCDVFNMVQERKRLPWVTVGYLEDDCK